MKKIKRNLAILGAFLLVAFYSLMFQRESGMISKVPDNKDKEEKVNPVVLNQDCAETQNEDSMLFVGCNGFF